MPMIMPVISSVLLMPTEERLLISIIALARCMNGLIRKETVNIFIMMKKAVQTSA